jgi:NAD(P)-dependent dehydrogenase (short-subunit alcohol dehydrogenase family)
VAARVDLRSKSSRVEAFFGAEHPSIGCYVTDVIDQEQIMFFFDDAQCALGGLDTFINGAGYSCPVCSVEDIPIEEIEALGDQGSRTIYFATTCRALMW